MAQTPSKFQKNENIYLVAQKNVRLDNATSEKPIRLEAKQAKAQKFEETNHVGVEEGNFPKREKE
jgi:hypothetical protein